MMNQLQTKEPLTREQLHRVAPSIFAQSAHESRSDRYEYIPTVQVLDVLQDEGFEPYFVMQSRTRNEGKRDFTQYMLRLRQTSDMQRRAVVGETVMEICLINSHDGSSSYQLSAGVFRFTCTNGMMVPDGILQSIKVRHQGNIVHDVLSGVFAMAEQFGLVRDNMDLMRSIPLTIDERLVLGEADLALKYEDDKAPITKYDVIRPNRRDDFKNDLWTTFNTIQEHMIKGGDRGVGTTGRRQTTRAVSSIDTSVKLNKALWRLADGMAKIKTTGGLEDIDFVTTK